MRSSRVGGWQALEATYHTLPCLSCPGRRRSYIDLGSPRAAVLLSAVLCCESIPIPSIVGLFWLLKLNNNPESGMLCTY